MENAAEKLSPYKMDIPQGNIVTQEMVAKLKPGMTPSQVRFILGTPLIMDTFHADRWDYVYRNQKAGKLIEERKLTLFFENDVLYRVGGDVGAETAPLEAAALPAVKAVLPDQKIAPKAAEEKGFFGKIMDKVGL